MHSSSSASLVDAAHDGAAMRAINAKIDEVVSVFVEMNPGANRAHLTMLCRTFFIDSDKTGFVYNFDEVYPILGYNRKDHAKRAVLGDSTRGSTGGGLVRGIDVKISAYLTPPGGGTKTSTGRGGDRRSEKIMLSWSGFSKFCQLSRTPQGDMVRMFTGSMVIGLRQLQKALDAGEVALMRKVTPCEDLKDAAVVRLDSCELTKELGLKLCRPGQRFDPSFGLVHGQINEAAMGMTKKEISTLIKKKLQSFSARDYMTPEQQMLARRIMIEACKETTREAAIACVHRLCEDAKRSHIIQAMQYKSDETPERFMTLKRARTTLAALEDAPRSDSAVENATRAPKRRGTLAGLRDASGSGCKAPTRAPQGAQACSPLSNAIGDAPRAPKRHRK